MMLTEKEIDILTSISNLRFMNGLQIHSLYGYKGQYGYVVTRRKLLQLEKAGYLKGWQPSKNEHKVYYLTKQGAKEVAFFHGFDKVPTYRKSEKTIHQCLVSEVYVRFRLESKGKLRRFVLNQKVGEAVADAFVQYDIDKRSKLMFIEVDRGTESIGYVKDIKLEQYKAGYRAGFFQSQFGIFPDIIFLTTSETRQRSLLRVAEGFKFKIKAFTFDEFISDPLTVI